MTRARGCSHVRLFLLLSIATLPLWGCSSTLAGPPYCPVKLPALAPATGRGGPLHQKALAYDRRFQEKLQPRPYGGAVNVIIKKGMEPGSPGSLLGYDDRQDSAIWTGTYLAAEAFRYAASSDPAEKQEALRNAKGAARTLHLFLEVTGEPGLLARFAGPLAETSIYLRGASPCTGSAPDPAKLCCAVNQCAQSPKDPSLFWLGSTTRDQYSGFFFGMGIAYRLIDDPELRRLIRGDLEQIVTVLRTQKWIIPGSEQPDKTGGAVEQLMQAAWLLLAAEVSDDRTSTYCQDYAQLVRDPITRDLLLAGDDLDWTNRYFQYYGFNLSFLAFYNLIQLEPQEARRSAYLKVFEDHVYQEVKGTGNSFFDYIALAVGANVPEGTLASAQGSLEPFPEPSGTWACVLPPESKLSQTSIDLYEANKELLPKDVKIFPRAERAYPIASWCRQDFLWQQTPYAICCCPVPEAQRWTHYQSVCDSMTPPVSDTETLIFPGVDYLVAYWMGRYHGFLKPES